MEACINCFFNFPKVCPQLKLWFEYKLKPNEMQDKALRLEESAGNFLTKLYSLTVTKKYDPEETWSEKIKEFLFQDVIPQFLKKEKSWHFK